MSLDFLKGDSLVALVAHQKKYIEGMHYKLENLCTYSMEEAQRELAEHNADLMKKAAELNAVQIFVFLSGEYHNSSENIAQVKASYYEMLKSNDTNFIGKLLRASESFFGDSKFAVGALLQRLSLKTNQPALKFLIKELKLHEDGTIDKSHLKTKGIVTQQDLIKIAANFDSKTLPKLVQSGDDLTDLILGIIDDADESDDFAMFDFYMESLSDINTPITKFGQNVLQMIIESGNIPLLEHFNEYYLTDANVKEAALAHKDAANRSVGDYVAQSHMQELFDKIMNSAPIDSAVSEDDSGEEKANDSIVSDDQIDSILSEDDSGEEMDEFSVDCDFLDPRNKRFDDLAAFQSFYEREVVGKNALDKIQALHSEALENGALRIVVTLQNMLESYADTGQIPAQTDASNVDELFDDLMNDDLGALTNIYPKLEAAYGSNLLEMITALKLMSIFEGGLALVYLLHSQRDSYGIGVFFDISKGTDKSLKEFDDPANFKEVYETLKDAFTAEKEDLASMRQGLLMRILFYMDNVEADGSESDDYELAILAAHGEELIEDLGWNTEAPENSKEMLHFLKQVVADRGIEAFDNLMLYQSFKNIFDGNLNAFVKILDSIKDEAVKEKLIEKVDALSLDKLADLINEASELHNSQMLAFLTNEMIFKDLQSAIQSGDTSAFDNLMSDLGENHINIALNENGDTALHIALRAGNSEFVAHLVDEYLTSPALMEEAIRAQNVGCSTPLHDVSPEIGEELLSKILKFPGASYALMQENADGLTPLLAAVNKYGMEAYKTINLFVNAGADIWVCDNEGQNLKEWVAFQVSDAGESHPLYVLYSMYSMDMEIEKLLSDIEAEVSDQDSAIVDDSDDAMSDSSDSSSEIGSPNRLSLEYDNNDLVPSSFGQVSHHCGNQVQPLGAGVDIVIHSV